MITSTRYFGEIEYEESDILLLPDGLFGFEDEKEYILIHLEDNNSSFLCMQSLNDEKLAFILTNPFHFLPDYNPELSKEDTKALKLSEDTPVSFYALCVLHEVINDSTMNLKCPIIINLTTRQARQVILENPSYQFKHCFKDMKSPEKKEGDHC